MSNFDYDVYASTVRLAIASPVQLQEKLNLLEQEYQSVKAKEEAQISLLSSQLSQKKAQCMRQYEEIRSEFEAVGLRVLPPQQRPIATQLYADDAIATQNNIAKEIKVLTS